MQRPALNTMYILLLADSLMLLLLHLLARKYMVLPLRELAAHSRATTSGNYEVGAAYRSTDEIGDLRLSLNRAARQIGQLVQDLEAGQE